MTQSRGPCFLLLLSRRDDELERAWSKRDSRESVLFYKNAETGIENAVEKWLGDIDIERYYREQRKKKDRWADSTGFKVHVYWGLLLGGYTTLILG